MQIAPVTYDDWTRSLGAFFFDEAHRGDEILFAVDDSTLAEISGLEPDDARQSLAHSIELVIGSQWNVHAVKRLVDRWVNDGCAGDHPALPFLAFTVLAASRMGAFPDVPPHNFYIPLRRTLNEADAEEGCPGTYLDYVRDLWVSVAAWANETLEGHRGRLIVRDPGVQYGRGLASQHALVKSYDLDQLDAFFRRIGLEPGEEVAPAELFRALKAWTAGRNELWAKRLSRICDDPDLEEYAQALLSREAARWDGKPRDPRTGKAVGRIRVGIESLKRPIVGFFVEYDERLPEVVELQLNSVDTRSLRRRDGWFQPGPLDGLDADLTLTNGIDLYGSGHRFNFRSDSVYALAHDEDLGAWVSTDRMSFGDRYHLLARYEVAESIRRFCESAGATEIQVLREAESLGLPKGWRLIRNVRLDARPSASPPACLASLIPVGSGPRLRLVGGLPLGHAFGVYLRGGEPSLALSSLCHDEYLTLTQASSGDTHRIRISALASREVDLSVFELEPDRYQITHGESSVSISIVDGIAEEAGPGVGAIRTIGRDDIEVRGTLLKGVQAPSRPFVIPAPKPDKPVYIVGARASELDRVEFPRWFSDAAGGLSWRSIDVWPRFTPVWAIEIDAALKYRATLICPLEPIEPLALDTKTRWARLLRASQLRDGESETSIELWAKYQLSVGVP